MEPFVALMRRYCIDYTNSHDQSICDEIMHEDYVVHISGRDLRRDAAYKPAVRQVYERFPGLGLLVHEFVTNGDRLAMRFSEHGCAADAGGNGAVWGGIGLYRWDGERLLENFVEEDFLSQQVQLDSGDVAPLEPPHVDPWVATKSEPTNVDAEAAVRSWLTKGELRAEASTVVDSNWADSPPPVSIDVKGVEINDLFSAGDRVAFHVSQRGLYRGGLFGVDDSLIGVAVTLHCAGIATVEGDRVVDLQVITDRNGARAELISSADRPGE